ncbi:MAG: heme A synthase [Flavobacteriaceae bacterium TMED238]|nr:MAG: heme A synthase [Flavobacteriaceae bacterium TMED238]|tara:strand:- start:780 stop:1805 length:1026 start_codon:yes stop_codon:yes gene_type:complete
MITNDNKINNLFQYWLTATLFLVFSIIIVGGLTRLTNSGLSITQWELFSGILPPLNQEEWETYFNLYKEIPQYKLLNNNMSMDEFKIIFYWEYWHRILARFIGLFFLIPFLYFYFTNSIKKSYINICFFIFFLILLQGIIGWYMVSSGLVLDVTVSHYRLSVHLILAFLIISIIFWLIINIVYKKPKSFLKNLDKNLYIAILFFFLFFQIILGAFVSGLDAGQIYQSWPKMGNSFFPNDIKIVNINVFFNFDNHSLVQFYHRSLAYIITCYILCFTFYICLKKIKNLYKPLRILLFVLTLQIILGIFTLLSGLDIYLSSAHQISSVLLVFSAINLYYFSSK